MIFENVTMVTGNVQIVDSRKFNLPPIKAEIEKILDEFEKGNIYTIPETPVKISCRVSEDKFSLSFFIQNDQNFLKLIGIRNNTQDEWNKLIAYAANLHCPVFAKRPSHAYCASIWKLDANCSLHWLSYIALIGSAETPIAAEIFNRMETGKYAGMKWKKR